MLVKCVNCNNDFEKATSKINEAKKYGWNFYCSKECQYEYKTKAKKFDCAQCGSEVIRTPGELKDVKNVFCGSSCAAIYNNTGRIHAEETKRKISNTLKGKKREYVYINKKKVKKEELPPRYCIECNKELVRKQKKFCSRACMDNNPNHRETLRMIQVKKVKNGTHSGWKSRSKITPSFAEKVTMDILNNKDLEYEFEYPVGKWFIDFAFLDKKLAIEIDGKQHELPERKVKDSEKDTYLIENGWTVRRIKWKGATKKTVADLSQRIDKILQTVAQLD